MRTAKASVLSTRLAKPVDLETRMTDDHHQALKLWLRLLSCTNLVEAEIRTRLRSEFGMTRASRSIGDDIRIFINIFAYKN